MKNSLVHLCSILFLFLALLATSQSIALLSTNQGEDVKVSEIKGASSVNELMGLEMERCEEGDEECIKRRLISEAHLDYIYTQQHKN